MPASVIPSRHFSTSSANPHRGPAKAKLHCTCRPASIKRRCTANSHPEENAESSGDAALQEELVKQLTRSMGKQRLIEAAKRSMDKAEKDRLKSELQDAKDKVEKKQRLELDRNSLEYDSLQADVNKAADDFDEILRKSRASLENDKAEFEMFERMVEKDRNRHLFFQDLYKRELRKKQSNSKKKARSEASRKPVPSFEYEPKQNNIREKVMRVEGKVRILVYGLMAGNLSALVLADVVSKSHPSVLDATVGFFAALLGWWVYTERQRLASGSLK